jgi:hypothetical protein
VPVVGSGREGQRARHDLGQEGVLEAAPVHHQAGLETISEFGYDRNFGDNTWKRVLCNFVNIGLYALPSSAVRYNNFVHYLKINFAL